MAQDDFLRATNFRGHRLGLDVYPWQDVEARFWVLSDEPLLPIDPSSTVDLVNGSRGEELRARMDITVYF